MIPSSCLIEDRLQTITASWNAYLQIDGRASNALIILYSSLGDAYLLFFFIAAIYSSSLRMILPLFVFLFFRQVLQALVTFPIPSGLIWHYPGLPALFTSYNISNDFYYSAYIGINLLVTLELLKYKNWWLTTFGFIIIFIEVFISIILRVHYTPDIYTSIITAIFVYLYVFPLSDKLERLIKRKFSHFRLILIGLIFLGLIAFYSVEHILAKKPISNCGIIDYLQQFTFPLNEYISSHGSLSDKILIVMNAISDCLGLFIIGLVIVKRDTRPFLMLLIFGLLRQSLQYLVSLPIPLHAIWHDPGFPSIFATYNVANDLYFSSHTGVSLIAALEMARFKKTWLTVLGFSIFFFEVSCVIVLQVHYTMDVFTAIMTVFCIIGLCSYLAIPLNRLLGKITETLSSIKD